MMDTMIDPEEAWTAVLARNRAFDGRFVTGVLSTGIYCRPSCATRHPARANVRFFADGAAARAAGLRPCKRCLPDDVSRDERAVLSAIAAIKAAGQPLALAALAAETGYSPSPRAPVPRQGKPARRSLRTGRGWQGRSGSCCAAYRRCPRPRPVTAPAAWLIFAARPVV